MTSYKVGVEDIHCQNCAAKIKEALEKDSDAMVSVDVKRKEVTIDSSLRVEEIYQRIEDAGFTPCDCEIL